MSKHFKVIVDMVGKESKTVVPMAFYIKATDEDHAKQVLHETTTTLKEGFDFPENTIKVSAVDHYKQKIIGEEKEYIVDIMDHGNGFFDVSHQKDPEIFVENLPHEKRAWILNNMFSIYEKMLKDPQFKEELVDQYYKKYGKNNETSSIE